MYGRRCFQQNLESILRVRYVIWREKKKVVRGDAGGFYVGQAEALVGPGSCWNNDEGSTAFDGIPPAEIAFSAAPAVPPRLNVFDGVM